MVNTILSSFTCIYQSFKYFTDCFLKKIYLLPNKHSCKDFFKWPMILFSLFSVAFYITSYWIYRDCILYYPVLFSIRNFSNHKKWFSKLNMLHISPIFTNLWHTETNSYTIDAHKYHCNHSSIVFGSWF